LAPKLIYKSGLLAAFILERVLLKISYSYLRLSIEYIDFLSVPGKIGIFGARSSNSKGIS